MSLTPEIEAFINDCVVSGRFRSTSKVVSAALRRLADHEHRRAGASQDGTARAPPVHAQAAFVTQQCK